MLFAKPIVTTAAVFLLGSHAAAVITPDDTSLAKTPDAPGLVPRSGCDQGSACPDFGAGFDLIVDSRYPDGTRCWLRLNDCGQCQNADIACSDISTRIFYGTCQGRQHIGISRTRMSSRRTWLDKGGYQCWRIRAEYPCGGVSIFTPDHQIDCKDE